jgi:hypothetical protein
MTKKKTPTTNTNSPKKKVVKKKTESEVLDHVPVVPYNFKLEHEKEEARIKAFELRKKGRNLEPIIVTEEGLTKKASELSFVECQHEIIRCATDPIYFIETYLTIFDQTQGDGGMIVPFKLFDFQKKLIHTYLNNRFIVANKYRQAGISKTTEAYVAWYLMFNMNRTVAIIANKLETAKDEIMNDIIGFIENCPEWLRPKTGKESENNLKDTQKMKRYDNGSTISAFSATGIRGPVPTLVFWDEVAFTQDNDKFWLATYPSLQTGGGAIMVSCVTKDTFTYTDKGIKQIKDFIPNEDLGGHIIDEYNVLGINKLRKGNIFFNNGFVDTLKVKTTYSELESSLNHKYWAYKIKENKYGIYKASELEVGDYVSIQYGMEIWNNNNDCSDFKPTESINIKNRFKPTEITPNLAYLIGLYISEGYAFDNIRNDFVHTTQFTLTCGDSLSHIFDEIGFKCYFDGIHYTISSKQLGEFFKYLGFDLKKKAKEKIIPSRLLEMSRENIVAMLQGIMDGDGYASYDAKRNKIKVGIGLSSKELVQQIRMIWGNFGILTDYQEVLVKPTKKVKVFSNSYRIVATGEFAEKYFSEIGFRFERKQEKIQLYDKSKNKHAGTFDNIPNGCNYLYEIYQKIKTYGELTELHENDIKIRHQVQHFPQLINSPSSRKVLLRFIDFEKGLLTKKYLESLSPIINENIIWTPIKEIEKSKNWTYDFSLPNDIIEENDFHHSVVYSQIIGYQTPNGLDSTFYKTFRGARSKENNFAAVELWWFCDPRYNKGLVWLKNKGKTNQLKIVDENWTDEERIKLMDDGWEASSPWFEDQVKNANGDMKRIAQEIQCSFLGSGDNFIAEEYLKDIEENMACAPIRQEYIDSNMWIWEDPQAGEDYIMGVDVSPGHGEDCSTINILKISEIVEEKVIIKNDKPKKVKISKHKIEQVAEYYGKVSPQMLSEIVYQYGKRYNDAYCVVDITGGYGYYTIEKLIEIGYANIHYADVNHKKLRDQLSGYVKQGQKTMSDGSVVSIDLIPGFFIGSNRASVLLELQRTIHMKEIIIRSMRLLNELKTFVTVSGSRVADHRRSFHDDSIMGLSIALYVLNYDIDRFKQNKKRNEKMLDAFLTANDIKEIEINNRDKNNKIFSETSVSPLNPYAANSWLFKGLKKR